MTKPIILLCGPPLSAVGGGPTHMRNMMASPLRFQYRFLHFESGSRGTESPARDETIGAKALRIVNSPLLLAWKIARSRPAAVHLNSVLDHKAFWRDMVYLFVSKSLRRKVVLQFHGGSLPVLCRRPWVRRVVIAALSAADAVVLLASSEKRDLEGMGVNRRLVVIPNGVDLSEYRGAEQRVHSGSVTRLGYMGRLVREKGIFEAITAVETLGREMEFAGIELRIAGLGPAYGEIEKYIRNRRLEGRVKLVGAVYGEKKIAFLRETDVFIFPSYHPEGLPYSIIESLAAGTPVIATRLAGIPDVVVDGVHGILIKPKDPGEVVKALRQLALSPEELRGMSMECRQWAGEKLGLNRLATQFGELYEKVRSGDRSSLCEVPTQHL